MKDKALIATLALMASAGFAHADTSNAPAKRLHIRHHHARPAAHAAALAPLGAAKPAARPVTATNTAPVPNEGVTAPIDTSDQTTSVAPSVMQIHYPPMGDGYTSGSSAQAMDDRDAAKVTGVQVKVPLGQ
jgi:hypothetical protein